LLMYEIKSKKGSTKVESVAVTQAISNSGEHLQRRSHQFTGHAHY